MITFNKTIPTVRFTLSAAAVLAFLFLAPPDAHAYKIMVEMTPEGLQGTGFSMKTENEKNGMVRFVLTRDLSKAPSFPQESDLQVTRSATLQVFGKSGLLAECDVEPNERQNTITYRFVIARNCVSESHFTLAEIEDYKGQTQGGYLGGGTIYKFRLDLFSGRPSSEKAP